MLDEAHNVSKSEGPTTGPTCEGVCRDPGYRGPTALCRAVRIRWKREHGLISVILRTIVRR